MSCGKSLASAGQLCRHFAGIWPACCQGWTVLYTGGCAGHRALQNVECASSLALSTPAPSADTPRLLTDLKLRAEHGRCINSGRGLQLDGLPTAEAKQAAISWAEQAGHGEARVNYKLRDWLFARQRYWGEPMPLVFPEGSEVGCLSAECCGSPDAAPAPASCDFGQARVLSLLRLLGLVWAASTQPPCRSPAAYAAPALSQLTQATAGQPVRQLLGRCAWDKLPAARPYLPDWPGSDFAVPVQDAVALPESELPLVLPETDTFKPSGNGESPLARVTDWVNTTDPSSGEAELLVHLAAVAGLAADCIVCSSVRRSATRPQQSGLHDQLGLCVPHAVPEQAVRQ